MQSMIGSMQSGMEKLVGLVEERVVLIANDLIEPLNMYINHHNETFHS